jgi:hypothetical protein
MVASQDLAVLAPHKFSHCRRLVVDIRDVQPRKRGEQREDMRPPYGIVFDFTYEDFLPAASESCTLCQCLKAEISVPNQSETRGQGPVLLFMKTDQLPQITVVLNYVPLIILPGTVPNFVLR